MNKQPKILLYDIETSPNLGYIWGKYEQNVIEYESEWYMLCFSYKWLGSDEVHVLGLDDFPLYKRNKENDKRLVWELYKLFNEADVIIAHNGNSFDIKKTNARFLFHGFTPPSPYKQIDTKLVAKRYFNFNSNKLDDIGNYFGLGRKMETGGFELWKGCMSGEPAAWQKMKEYNIQDVVLLEQVYLKMRPWMRDHPNHNLYTGDSCSCPNCGSTNIQRRGTGVTRTGKYQRFSCQDCGSWSKGKPIKLEDKPIS